MVADRLDREGLALDDDVALDFLRADLREVFALEEGHDVVLQVRCDGQAMRLLAPAQLEHLAEFGARLAHRHPAGGRGDDRFALAQSGELLLGLRLRQTIARADAANGADPAFDASLVGAVPRADPGLADLPK